MGARIIFWVLCCWATLLPICAQDIIRTRNGESIPCEIISTERDFISYYLNGDDSKTRYMLSTSEIQEITFSDGRRQLYNSPSTPDNSDTPRTETGDPPAKIVLTNGTEIQGDIVERKRFGITVRDAKDLYGQPRYIPLQQIARIEHGNEETEYIQERPPKQKAQKTQEDFSYLSPHYTGLTFGALLPMGEFGAHGGYNPGYAGPGYNMQAEITGYVFRGTGLSAIIGYGNMGYRNPGVRQAFENYFKFAPSYQDAVVQSVSSGSWNMFWAQGAMGYFSDWGRVKLDSRIAIGMLNLSYPEQKVRIQQNGAETDILFYRYDARGVMITGSLYARVFITRKWQARFGFDITSADVRFSNKWLKMENGITTEDSNLSGIGSSNILVGFVGFNLGVAYTIGQ